MNSKLRWQLHSAVEENFDNLFTFSVGEEDREQVVVCRLPVILRKIASGQCTHEKALLWAGSKHGCPGPLRVVSSTRAGWSKRQKMKTMQETSVHLPPRPSSDSSRSQSQNETRKISRRPDIQLYVPRGRRSTEGVSSQQQAAPAPSGTVAKKSSKSCPADSQCGKAESVSQPAPEALPRAAQQAEENLGKAAFLLNNKQDDSNAGPHVPSCGENFASVRNIVVTSQSDVQVKDQTVETGSEMPLDEANSDVPSSDCTSRKEPTAGGSVNCALGTGSAHGGEKTSCEGEKVIVIPDAELQQEGPLGSLVKTQDVEGEEESLPEPVGPQDALPSSDLNGTLASQLKESNLGPLTSASCEKPCLSEQRNHVSGVVVPVLPPTEPPLESMEKESWDSLFDENGDCLHPTVLDGLKSALGKVEIQKPKFDYLVFQPPEPDLSDECYDHIVEVYDFPAEFKTQNLMMAFSSFKDRGFDIKWVDDTHALAIFSSPLAAAEALEVQNPFIKIRPVSQAISKSKNMLYKNLDYLLPSKPRPETSALRARRMITGALGMRSSVSKEERETERRKLQAAKEMKRQVAKQKQDIWNGTVS